VAQKVPVMVMDDRASSLAKAGFATTVAASSLIAAVLLMKGNIEWVFFTSLAVAASIQIILCSIRQLRRHDVLRTIADVGSLSIIAATAAWLWVRAGNSLMLVNAVAVLAIVVIYLITVLSERGGGELLFE